MRIARGGGSLSVTQQAANDAQAETAIRCRSPLRRVQAFYFFRGFPVAFSVKTSDVSNW
jgi:hypothetical protein